MNFDEQEQQIIDYGLQNNRSQDEVEQAIAKYRQTKMTAGGSTGLIGVGSGFIKSAGETLQNIGKGTLKALTFGKADTDKLGFSDEQLERRGGAEKLGGFLSEVAQFGIPAAKVGKLAKALNLGTKATLATRVATSGTIGTAQQGELGREGVIAGASELAFPAVGKVAKGLGGVFARLIKGIGSTASGVGSDALESIVRNPTTAKQVAKQITAEGTEPTIRKNAQAILNGVRNVRREARKTFGNAISELKAEDIDPKAFRNSLQPFFDKYQISSAGKERILTGVEFDKQSLLNKASNLIDEVSRVDLNGKDLRSVLKKVENARFKTTGGDAERLSFNAFLTDLTQSLNKAVGESTDKLGEINQTFSSDMQLVDGIEKIFGKMKFYNEKELVTASERLSQLFNKKGLAPSTIDKFLNRIGISPDDFRTTEAVRQITEKDFGANQIGTTVSEFLRSITSSVVTPELVRDVAINIGTTGQKLAPVLNSIEPSLRPLFITSMVELFESEGETE